MEVPLVCKFTAFPKLISRFRLVSESVNWNFLDELILQESKSEHLQIPWSIAWNLCAWYEREHGKERNLRPALYLIKQKKTILSLRFLTSVV